MMRWIYLCCSKQDSITKHALEDTLCNLIRETEKTRTKKILAMWIIVEKFGEIIKKIWRKKSMRKKIVGICICTLVLAMALLPIVASARPVASNDNIYKLSEQFSVKGGFVCCGAYNVWINIQPLSPGANFVWGKTVILASDICVCVGVAGLKKANWFGQMTEPYGAPFGLNLTIGKFYGVIILPAQTNPDYTPYILTGIGRGNIRLNTFNP
jgi:hypothetical protein